MPKRDLISLPSGRLLLSLGRPTNCGAHCNEGSLAGVFKQRGGHGGFCSFEGEAEKEKFLTVIVVELDPGKAVFGVVEEDDEAVLDLVLFKNGRDLFLVLCIEERVEAQPSRFEILKFQFLVAPWEDVDQVRGDVELFDVFD